MSVQDDYLSELVLAMAKDEVVEELRRARADHEEACALAWELYLAGTEQTMESFRGVRSEDPVSDVIEHIANIKGTEP